jgi:hypothetical protein
MDKEKEITQQPKPIEDAIALLEKAISMVEQESINLSKSEDAQAEQDDDEANGGEPEVVNMGGEPMEKEAEEPVAEDKIEEEPKEDEEKDEEKDEKKDESEDEESDEDAMNSFEKAKAKVEARGLLKSAPKTEQMKKTAHTEDLVKSEINSLRKSYDNRFDSISASVEKLTKSLEKIASRPQPRRGATNLAPLRKSDHEPEQEQMSKSEVINQLFQLQKSGDTRVTPGLIYKVECNKLDARDFKTLKGILG